MNDIYFCLSKTIKKDFNIKVNIHRKDCQIYCIYMREMAVIIASTLLSLCSMSGQEY